MLKPYLYFTTYGSMRVRTTSAILDVVTKITRVTRAKPFKLRGSNLPICKSDHALSLWTENAPPIERLSLINVVSFAVGEAVHRAWQTWLGDEGLIYGNWACPRCGRIDIGYQRQCPTCYAHRNYHEIAYSEPFGMKVDAPIKSFYSDRVDQVWEFKTAGQDKWQEKTRADESHILQVQCYGEKLRNDGWPIKTVAVVYLNRNSPWQPKAFAYKPVKVLDKITASFEESRDAAQKGRIPDHEPPTDDACTWCKWKWYCYAPSRNRIFKKLSREYLSRTR